MLYIRFLNFQTPLQDIEKMYKDGDIKYGDIVCQQYNDKSSHLFMNGTWIKTLYNSKIKQNNEIEDDIEFLSTAIGNNSTNIGEVSTRLNDTSTRLNNVSTMLDNTSNNLNDTSIRLNDVSTRLKDDYVNKTQYLKDEELIASTFADLNNKINNFDITKQLEPIYSNISNLNSSVQNVSDVLYTLTETENINHTIDTFKEVEKFLNNISDSSTLTELLLNTKDDIIDGISEYYYNIEEMDGKIGDINTSINNTSSRIKELEKLYSNDQIDTFLGNLNTSIKDTSDNLNIVSISLLYFSLDTYVSFTLFQIVFPIVLTCYFVAYVLEISVFNESKFMFYILSANCVILAFTIFAFVLILLLSSANVEQINSSSFKYYVLFT